MPAGMMPRDVCRHLSIYVRTERGRQIWCEDCDREVEHGAKWFRLVRKSDDSGIHEQGGNR